MPRESVTPKIISGEPVLWNSGWKCVHESHKELLSTARSRALASGVGEVRETRHPRDIQALGSRVAILAVLENL